jgi:MinD-like ATPase involved in chromosome partitioning or flagellar assembly
MAEVIGILSLKGGVGKTSSVIALGAALSHLGKKVLLIDGNFSAPNLSLYLNMLETNASIQDVLRKKDSIENSICVLDYFDVIPASVYDQKVSPLKLKDRIKPLKKKYDFIIIDSSPALNDETLAVMMASDKLFVVTTPDYPTLKITMKAVDVTRRRDTPIAGLIINKSYNKKFELSIPEIEEISGVPVMAIIPYNVNVLKALSESVPSVIYRPNCEGSIEYKKLAATLIGEKYKRFNLKNLFHRYPKQQEENRETYYETIFG